MCVISPMLIYLLGLVDSLLPILSISSLALIFVSPFIWIIAECNPDGDMTEYTKQKYKKFAKNCVVVSVILMIFYIIIPNKETITQMFIAKNITVDRVQIASEVVQKIYNDIIGIMNKQ